MKEINSLYNIHRQNKNLDMKEFAGISISTNFYLERRGGVEKESQQKQQTEWKTKGRARILIKRTGRTGDRGER